MTKVEIRKLDKSQVEITGEISAEDFASFWKKALVNFSQTVKIDGFRSGHIPEDILIKNIGEGAVLDSAAELALQSNYPKIIVDNNIDAIGRPTITITKIAKGNPLGFKIVNAVIPKVTLPDYGEIARKIFTEEKGKDFVVTDKGVSAKEALRFRAIEAIDGQSVMEIPDNLVENELSRGISQMKSEVEQGGMEFEEYLKNVKKSVEEIKKESRGKAEKSVRYNLVLKNIARAENIVIPSQEITGEAEKLVKIYSGADLESAKVYVEDILINDRVFQFLEGKNS